MEKLSSILPSSPRVKNVDMADSHPIRPGVQSYGRLTGVTPVKDRFSVSEQAKDLAFKETLASANPKDAKAIKAIDDMAKKFFEGRVESPVGKSMEPIAADQIQEELLETTKPQQTETKQAPEVQKGSKVDLIA